MIINIDGKQVSRMLLVIVIAAQTCFDGFVFLRVKPQAEQAFNASTKLTTDAWKAGHDQ